MTTIRFDEAAADLAAREDRCSTPPSAQERFRKTCERLREGRLPAFALVAMDGAGRLVGTVRLWHVSAGPGRPRPAARPAGGRRGASRRRASAAG